MIARLMGIRIFDIEAAGACNLDCPFCPRDQLPPVGLISQETFGKFLDHVPLGATDSLAFVGIGEPTLNLRLPDFIRQAKNRNPRLMNTWVTSNGTFLNERTVPALLDAGLETLRESAKRQFTIRWAEGVDPSGIKAPAFIEILQRTNRQWLGRLTGPAPAFIGWASQQPVEDLTIGHPDLDSLFREYYQRGSIRT